MEDRGILRSSLSITGFNKSALPKRIVLDMRIISEKKVKNNMICVFSTNDFEKMKFPDFKSSRVIFTIKSGKMDYIKRKYNQKILLENVTIF